MSRKKGEGARGRCWHAVVAASLLASTVLACIGIAAPAASAATVCGASTVELAYEGTCASFGSATAWYGSYGPGFPTADGWVLAAGPAGLAAAPTSAQDYGIGDAPTGAATATAPALGFALSEAQATDQWTGGSTYSASDEATAAQLLYDQVVWGSPPPVVTGGVLAAYDVLDGWYDGALGATGSPILGMNTTAIAQVPTAGAIYQVRLSFPGSGTAASGYDVTLSLTGGYVTGGSTSVTILTDGQGYASEEIYADSSATAVSVTATATVGTPALDFLDSSSGGEPVVSFAAPTIVTNSDVVGSSAGSGGTGTVSIDEGGDDTAYVGLAGGVYDVSNSLGTVVAVLTTDSSGAAGPSAPLPLGTYTVHEATAPPGYSPSPDQSVTLVDGGNVVAHFTGAYENHAIPATLTISDTDQQTGVPLAGATFEITDDTNNDGVFSDPTICTTGFNGACSAPANDGLGILPGGYHVVEVASSNGYYLDRPSPTQTIDLAPGESGSVHFSDLVLGSLELTKTGNDTAYYGVDGATFDVAGPLPSAGLAGLLTIGSSGSSNVVSGLEPGTYTVTETTAPPGYGLAAPFDVTVALGHDVTQASVEDAVNPGTLDIYNVAADSSTPVVGGVFDVRYDALDSGSYSVDLGTCTTDAIGACSPATAGSLGLLPGRYEVTEVSAPPGYGLDASALVRQTVLLPGAVDVVDFDDPHLVALSFTKVPTANFDPMGLDLAGADFVVRSATPTGPVVASCTTDAGGSCTTASVLLPGTSYCWSETAAPPGFAAGESGCLDTGTAEPATPVVVDEPGEFVAIRALKVEAGDPSHLLAGALFDLYRMDGGAPGPAAPPGTPALAGGTWVASATSSASGPVAFPLQLPGFAYCVVEVAPPPGYELSQAPSCSAVLEGSTATPPAGATVTIADHPVAAPVPVAPSPASPAPEAPVAASRPEPAVSPPAPGPDAPARPAPSPPSPPRASSPAPGAYTPAPAIEPPALSTRPATPVRPAPGSLRLTGHAYDALQPSSPVAGAVYDLYAVGTGLAFAPASEPVGPAPARVGGQTWVARSRTDSRGDLAFVVPAGYAWCLRQVAAPPDFVLARGERCTTVLAGGDARAAASVRLPEQPLMVDVQAHKYNTLEPGTSIAGATYDLYSEAVRAPGARDPAALAGPGPARLPGAVFYERGVTGRNGMLVMEVPAGYAWCLKELRPPPGYRYDAGSHCTTVLGTASAVAPVHLALPELPRHLPPPPRPAPELPFTGIDLGPLIGAGGALVVLGASLCALGAWGSRSGEREPGGTRSRREPCGARRPESHVLSRPPPRTRRGHRAFACRLPCVHRAVAGRLPAGHLPSRQLSWWTNDDADRRAASYDCGRIQDRGPDSPPRRLEQARRR